MQTACQGKQTDSQRLNAALFAYIAAVMRGDNTLAGSRLTQFETVIKTLPPQFSNNWAYPGTNEFIRKNPFGEECRRTASFCVPGKGLRKSKR